MRIAFIGAGSVGFTQKLVRDILTVPELQETEFSLQDISQDNLEMVKQLLEKDISANGLPAKVCLLYTSPSPRDQRGSRMPSSA